MYGLRLRPLDPVCRCGQRQGAEARPHQAASGRAAQRRPRPMTRRWGAAGGSPSPARQPAAPRTALATPLCAHDLRRWFEREERDGGFPRARAADRADTDV